MGGDKEGVQKKKAKIDKKKTKDLNKQAKFKEMMGDRKGAIKTAAKANKKKQKSYKAMFQSKKKGKKGVKKVPKRKMSNDLHAKLWRVAPVAFKSGPNISKAWF